MKMKIAEISFYYFPTSNFTWYQPKYLRNILLSRFAWCIYFGCMTFIDDMQEKR